VVQQLIARLRRDMCNGCPWAAQRAGLDSRPQGAGTGDAGQAPLAAWIINMPPRHLKSHLASVAFPAWCLGHDPSAQILCVSYAQDFDDKLSRDCRDILTSDWYRQLFATRLSAQRQALSEFETPAQGCRLATSVGGVLTGRGTDMIIIDDPLKPSTVG
jgi:hypothetical protein